ncbi:fz domain protein, partial [Ostertagia ostertagi]
MLLLLILLVLFGTIPMLYTKGCQPITIPLCKGIGYNMTSFPNSYGHEKQEEAGLEVHQFFPLVEYGCYQHLKFFLCTLYTPICQENYDRPILPCMVSAGRRRIVREPATMSEQASTGNICAAPPDTPKQTKIMELPPVSAPRPHVGISVQDLQNQCECSCQPPFQTVSNAKAMAYFVYYDLDYSKFLIEVGNVSRVRINVSSCYRSGSRELISELDGFGFPCLLSASISNVSQRNRSFQYPERPIFMLVFCQLMVAVGFIIRVSAGHEQIACDAYKIKGIDDGNGSLCFVVFLLTYFFGMAACVWWIILSLSWVLAAASKWSSEAIASYSAHFHAVGWLLPAAQTVIVLVFNAIDGDPVSGMCYVGNTDVNHLRMFVLGPLILYFSLGVLFLFVGFFNLWRIRNEVQKQHPGLCNASKLTNLMTKIGTFSVLYTLPALFVILSLIYEQHHRPLWEQSITCTCADR